MKSLCFVFLRDRITTGVRSMLIHVNLLYIDSLSLSLVLSVLSVYFHKHENIKKLNIVWCVDTKRTRRPHFYEWQWTVQSLVRPVLLLPLHLLLYFVCFHLLLRGIIKMGPKKRNKGEKTTSTNQKGNNVSETPHLCNFRQYLCVPSAAQLQTHPLHALPQPACRVVLLSTIKYPIDLSLISFSFSYFISRGSDE